MRVRIGREAILHCRIFTNSRFAHVTDDLVAILLLVLTTRNVNPEVEVVGGLDDGLVKVRVGGQELKPTIQDVHICVGKVVLPTGVGCLRNLDISGLANSVLAGIDATDLGVESVATIAGIDDDGLTGKSTERLETLLAELHKRRDEL